MHGQILINLSISLAGLYIFYLISGFINLANIKELCGISAAFLHYIMLVFFSWTSIEAVWLYLKLVKIFGIERYVSHYTLKSGLLAWSKLFIITYGQISIYNNSW